MLFIAPLLSKRILLPLEQPCGMIPRREERIDVDLCRSPSGAPRRRSGLPLQQREFPFDPPAVTARISVAADHPVTGDGQGEGIRCARPGHGASRAGLPDPAGDLPVTRRRTGGNPPELLPDPLLEGRAAKVQGKVQTAPRGHDRLRHPAEPTDGFRIPLGILPTAEPGLEGIDEGPPGIAELDGTKTPHGAGDEHPSEVGPRHGEADRLPLSPGPMRCGRLAAVLPVSLHAFSLHGDALSHNHIHGTPGPIFRALLPLPIFPQGSGPRHPFLPLSSQNDYRERTCTAEGALISAWYFPGKARWNPPVFPSCGAGTMYTVCKFGYPARR